MACSIRNQAASTRCWGNRREISSENHDLAIQHFQLGAARRIGVALSDDVDRNIPTSSKARPGSRRRTRIGDQGDS
jgi:hypothetical protein